jgi:hypothetical protein
MSRLERGGKQPSLAVAEALVSALGIEGKEAEKVRAWGLPDVGWSHPEKLDRRRRLREADERRAQHEAAMAAADRELVPGRVEELRRLASSAVADLGAGDRAWLMKRVDAT